MTSHTGDKPYFCAECVHILETDHITKVLSVISLSMQVEHGMQCMPFSSLIKSEMLPKIHRMETRDFLKPLIRSQILSSLCNKCNNYAIRINTS